jgi:hypothetical protein
MEAQALTVTPPPTAVEGPLFANPFEGVKTYRDLCMPTTKINTLGDATNCHDSGVYIYYLKFTCVERNKPACLLRLLTASRKWRDDHAHQEGGAQYSIERHKLRLLELVAKDVIETGGHLLLYFGMTTSSFATRYRGQLGSGIMHTF